MTSFRLGATALALAIVFALTSASAAALMCTVVAATAASAARFEGACALRPFALAGGCG